MNDSRVDTSVQSVRIDKVIRERSLKAAYAQSLYWAVMFGAGECYFALFAEHLKVPPVVFGYLCAVPNLLGPLVQIVAANIVERAKLRRALVLWGAGLQAFSLLPLALLPYVVGNQLLREILLLALVLLYFLAGHFVGPPWNSMIGVLVPSAQRADWFARAARGVNAVSLVAKLLVGGALFWAGTAAAADPSALKFKLFAAAFLTACLFRVFSLRQIWKMYDPPHEHTAADSFTFWQFMRRAPESNFVKFAVFVALLQFGAQLAGPYFVPYTIRVLGYQQWHWVLLDASAVVASVLTFMFWGRFSSRFGNKKTIKYTTYGVAVIPLLWLISPNIYCLLAANFFSGFAWAGFNLCVFNYILEACSPPKRARCLAYFAIIVGVGISSGAMAGSWLLDRLPQTAVAGVQGDALLSFPALLVLSAAVRLIAGVFFLPVVKELGKVEPFSLTKWIFYIAQTRQPVGVEFEANVEEAEEGDSENEKDEK